MFRFDPSTVSGSVLRDDGVEIGFEAAALDGTGLRHLRPGQRVALEVSGPESSPHIERLQILTLS